MAEGRHVVAMGGTSEPDDVALLRDRVCALTGVDRPAVCFLGTASGDAPSDLDIFYQAFSPSNCRPMHLSLFKRQRGDLRRRLLGNDAIVIGGGSTANLLAIWRLHGMDVLVREAAAAGAVLAGVSAGACCLFEACLTDSFGPKLAVLCDGLGLLSGSFCPHDAPGSRRRTLYREAVTEGRLGAGYAVEDGVALHFVDGALMEAVCARPGLGATHLSRGPSGLLETPLVGT